MGVRKRPKLKRGVLSSGREFFYSRKPILGAKRAGQRATSDLNATDSKMTDEKSFSSKRITPAASAAKSRKRKVS